MGFVLTQTYDSVSKEYDYALKDTETGETIHTNNKKWLEEIIFGSFDDEEDYDYMLKDTATGLTIHASNPKWLQEIVFDCMEDPD